MEMIPSEIARDRSTGEPMAFRRLSHRFVVRCDDPAIGSYVAQVLGRFAEPGLEPDAATTSYEVLDLGPSAASSRYRLLIDGAWVLGSGDPSPVLDDLFSYVNVHAVEAARELVLVHAGAVVAADGKGVVLPAPSGSGKSTLVAGLVRAGFGYLSDEAAVLDPTTGRLHPYPVHLSLKGSSRNRFPEAQPSSATAGFLGNTWHVDHEAIRRGAVAASCEVGLVIAHRYEAGADLRIEPLTPAAGCVELVGNLMLGRRDAGRSLDLLARVCGAARSFRLVHGDLDAAVQAIVALTDGDR